MRASLHPSATLSLLKVLLSGYHGFDTVVHILHQSHLGSAESSLVRDIVNVVVGLSVLSMGSADLHMESVSNSLEFSLPLSEQGQMDVHRGAQGSSKVGGAGS